MTYTLSGFTDGDGVRRFAFQRAGVGGEKTRITVGADINLARKYEIRLQELPLICLQMLESCGDGALAEPITLTEDRMITIQTTSRALAEKKIRKPAGVNLTTAGKAWRAAQS
jgi:hypothetical protein